MKRSTAGVAAAALIMMVVGPAGGAAGADIRVDGRAADWEAADLIGTSIGDPTDANATADLKALYAADNGTDWFFLLTLGWRGPPANASLALYLFGPDGNAPASEDPAGNLVGFPAGNALVYAIYFELTPSFPNGSHATFFDGLTWKNRTFAELGVVAVLNESTGMLELSGSRGSFAFLHPGRAAAVELMPAPGGAPGPKTLVDAIPDDPAPSGGHLSALVPFFDYAAEPPVDLTALGLSNPFASQGEQVQVFVELTNTGPKNITGLSAQVLVDGVVAGARGGLFLLHGGTAVVEFNWTVAAGSHNVTAVSFPGGASRTLMLTVRPAGAQLRVVDATASPSAPTAGQTFAVDVSVHNDGVVASPPSRVLLKDGTQVIATANLAPVSANGSTVVRLEAQITRTGIVPLRVEIDGETAGNSSANLALTVSAPSSPFGIPGPVILVAGAAGCAAAAWVLAPRLQRRRERTPPPPEAPPPPP